VGPSRHPKFARPPISEIAISILFPQSRSITTAHLGRFWERVAKELPKAEDHSPSGLPQDWGKSIEGLPLPRLWLKESGGTVLLQLQVNRFDLNWRSVTPTDTYPTFDVQIAKLVDYWQRFAAFLNEQGEGDVPIRGAEVLKVSQIREGEGWQHWSDLHALFPALNLTQVGDRWDFQGLATAFEMQHEAGKVRADLKLGFLAAEPTRRALLLELKSEASNIEATIRNTGNLVDRLTVANDLANLAFTSLMSLKVQTNVWGRTA
jgi:uncharacterized protein (TIGR04255 family)